MKIKNGIILCILCLVLASCEKTEFIATSDGLSHCPLNWLSQSWYGNTEIIPANPQDSNLVKSKFVIENGALRIQRFLDNYNFMLLFQGQQRGDSGFSYRSLSDSYTLQLDFKPEQVDEGVQLKFFLDSLGANGLIHSSFGFYNSPYAISIQKEQQGYIVGYEYNNIKHQWPGVLSGFDSGHFIIKKSAQEITLEVELTFQTIGGIESVRHSQTLPYTANNQLFTPGLKTALLPEYANALPHRSFWEITGFYYTGAGQIQTDEFECNSLSN